MEAKRFYVSEIVSEEAAEKLCLGKLYLVSSLAGHTKSSNFVFKRPNRPSY